MTERKPTFTPIAPTGVAPPVPPYTHVVVSGDLVAISGQMPIDTEGRFLFAESFEAQAHQTFQNIKLCLEAAGCTFADVFKVNGYLADLANIDVYNAVFKTYFDPPYPARTTVGAALIGDTTLVEVDALARRPAS
jgi:2-iminobutanoate/2-iminopropanoate deaminase